ncbi:hypothetical protein [Kordia sp.]|uniref:hypothetical protein n=1 Tax=Kordia sp. TaxID=1965332 RepID=UPI003D6A8984
MKKTIFMLVVLAFFSCSTDDERAIQEEVNTLTEKSRTNTTDYNDNHWGTVNAFYYNNREAVKIWMQYGQYKAVKRNEVDRIVFSKIPGRAVYYADPDPIVDPTRPEEGIPGTLIRCDFEDDLINSTDWWAIALMDDNNTTITLDEAVDYEQQQQQEIANSTGQAIFFKICYNGLFIKSMLLLPDGSVIGSPDGVVTEPGEVSGSWSPE